jgi:lysozyme
MITDITSQLKRDEGLRLVPYKDTRGKVTVGYGHNLTDDGGPLTPITQAQANAWLVSDIAHAKSELLEHLPWATMLAEVYAGVLTNLCFNMGIGGLLEFQCTLNLIHSGRYGEAADELLRSAWATEVGLRANRLYTQLKTGQWQ